MIKLPQTKVVSDYIKFEGGLDVMTPEMSKRPGAVRDSVNVYQDINGGYATIKGYEPYDGLPSPASAQWLVLDVTITGSVSIDDVLTDDAETSYGTVILIESDFIVLTKVTGAFSTGDIKVSSVVVGTCTGAGVINGGATGSLKAEYASLAATEYMSDISAIPGSGDVLGVWYYNGSVYGFRNNSGATAAVMYEATGSGWSEVDLGFELPFTSGGGAYTVVEEDVIVGETSGATATVTRVVLESGTFAGGDAAGRLIFASQTGTFQAETIKVGTNLDVATIAGDSSAITFSVPSGRFEFVNANFSGSSDTYRMYGVDGKNRGFEFDGTVFVPIDTGMTNDAPEHVYFHKFHLFYSYLSVAQHCAPGLPYQWTVVIGPDEIGMGEEITGFLSMPGAQDSATLAIFTRNSIGMLYGNGSSDWNLVHYKREAGAIEWSQQLIGNAFMLDDRGIVKLGTSQAYGNFTDATESNVIQSWLSTKRTQLQGSCIIRDLNQYWLFFADNSALCCTVDDGEIVAFMPMLFSHKATCLCSAENDSGDEVVFFGSSDGFVYQMMRGTSFAGSSKTWALSMAYNHFKTPRQNKRFRNCLLELFGNGYAEFSFAYELSYGSSSISQPQNQLSDVNLESDNWDSSVLWDSAAVWDGRSLTPERFRMQGSGTNMSITMAGSGIISKQLKFSGALVQYTPTREFR